MLARNGVLYTTTFRMRTPPAPPVRTAKRSCRTLPLLPRVPSVARSGAPQSGRDAHGGLEKTRRFPRKVDFQAARGPRWDTLRNNRFPHRKGSRNAFFGPSYLGNPSVTDCQPKGSKRARFARSLASARSLAQRAGLSQIKVFGPLALGLFCGKPPPPILVVGIPLGEGKLGRWRAPL